MIRSTANANSRTPIVALTSYQVEQAEKPVFDVVLEKPVSSKGLCEVLENLCMWKPLQSHASAHVRVSQPNTPKAVKEQDAYRIASA